MADSPRSSARPDADPAAGARDAARAARRIRPDPRVAERLAHLTLTASRTVEGFLAGRHRSPHRGVSVEFVERRPYVQGDDPTSMADLDFFELDDFNQEGAETTFTASVRLSRSLLYLTDLEVFADFSDSDPTIDWRNTVSYRLNRFASLDYTLDALRIPQVLDKTQMTQNLLLRFSFDIL